MARQVEETLQRILGEAKQGTAEVEGAQEIRLLKERNRVGSWITRIKAAYSRQYRYLQTFGHRCFCVFCDGYIVNFAACAPCIVCVIKFITLLASRERGFRS